MDRRETLRLIGNSAFLALPLAPVAAASAMPAPSADHMERARRAWSEFSAAMDAMTLDAHGWMVLGAGHRRPFPGVRTRDSRWLNVVRLRLETRDEHPDGFSESQRRIHI